MKCVDLLAAHQGLWLDDHGYQDPVPIKEKLDDHGLTCPVFYTGKLFLWLSVCSKRTGTEGALFPLLLKWN